MERFLKSRYRIGKKIGENPYSLTYKGTFLANDTPLIIKIYKRATLNSSLIQNMKHKVKEFSQINHPNIARLYDGDYGWQGFYYVREYISGQSLRELLNFRKKLDADYAASLLLKVCAALKEAHRHGIVHGGIKPDNVFLNQKNILKVTDFVIEGEIKESLQQKAKFVLERQAYISPEELLGNAAGVSSDIFVLGLLLHEMLTGKEYFSGERNYFESLRRMKVIKDAPKYINNIIYKILQEDPLLRFSSIDELEESLREKTVVIRRERINLPHIELEDMEQPEVSEMKVIKAERKRSFRLLFLVVLAVIAGLIYAVFSTMRF